MTEEAEFDVYQSITFDWIVCGDDRSKMAQTGVVNKTWTADLEKLWRDYESQVLFIHEDYTLHVCSSDLYAY